jgi:hypothetical protein
MALEKPSAGNDNHVFREFPNFEVLRFALFKRFERSKAVERLEQLEPPTKDDQHRRMHELRETFTTQK